MPSLELYLLLGSALILLSIFSIRYSDKYGIPTLILFLFIGMAAGSEGIGKIYFDDANLARNIGIVSLIVILFAGGLETDWKSVKSGFWASVSLSTLGVFISTAVFGVLVHYITGIDFVVSLLLGAIISSTDAAAVFSILNRQKSALKQRLKSIIILESGFNDPAAIFLTMAIINVITAREGWVTSAILFPVQMIVGAITGYFSGKLLLIFLRKMDKSYYGVYMIFVLASVFFLYTVTHLIYGSGFLAVYVFGIVINTEKYGIKKSLSRFFDALGWLGQIIMFLSLGLLIFPSKLLPIAPVGIVVSAILILFARPVSVFISTIFSKISFKGKLFISWTGLRGAVPIILATFPLMYGVQNADLIFSLIFFVVLTSVIFQGWTIMPAAKLFNSNSNEKVRPEIPIEMEAGANTELVDFYIPENSPLIDKIIQELDLPDECLIVLIIRNEKYVLPKGYTAIKQGDIVMALVEKEMLQKTKSIFSEVKA